jgi:hypothetical protein
MQCLFRFYSYGLEKRFRADLFDAFQKDVVNDLEKSKSLCTATLDLETSNHCVLGLAFFLLLVCLLASDYLRIVTFNCVIDGLEKMFALRQYRTSSKPLPIKPRLLAYLKQFSV